MRDLHDAIVSATVGADYANADADVRLTTLLVYAGLAFTLVQSVVTALMPAPYGRYAQAAPIYLKWFEVNTAFAWVLQECPAFLVPSALLREAWDETNLSQKILLGALLIHYFQRSFVFPFLLRSGTKTTPFLPCIMAFIFCCYNGFLQAHAVIYSAPLGEQEILSWRFISGLFLFVLGLWINVDSDRRLRNLRSVDSTKDDSKSRYKIPRGGAFEYVSAANYFGEITEWIGFYVAGANLAGAFFAIFAMVFLGNRGMQHHRFYKEQFGSTYPKNRKAVIPFLF